jgi:hypothetical protein
VCDTGPAALTLLLPHHLHVDALLPPTLTPTATNTEPTPVPGVEVVPLASACQRHPLASYDDSNKPMSLYYGFNGETPSGNVLVRRLAAAVDRKRS